MVGFLRCLTLVGLFSSVIASPNVERDIADGPDPRTVTILSFQYNGSGCPVNSTGSTISPDQTTITITFSQYAVQVYQGSLPDEARKNCQITLLLHYPQGWQYSILQSIYRGYTSLDYGVNGLQKSTYYFSGQTAQVSTQTSFTGPYDDDFTLTDRIPFTSTVWSPCGASFPLNVNTQMRVSRSTSSQTSQGLMENDSADISTIWQVGVQWRRCPGH